MCYLITNIYMLMASHKLLCAQPVGNYCIKISLAQPGYSAIVRKFVNTTQVSDQAFITNYCIAVLFSINILGACGHPCGIECAGIAETGCRVKSTSQLEHQGAQSTETSPNKIKKQQHYVTNFYIYGERWH